MGDLVKLVREEREKKKVVGFWLLNILGLEIGTYYNKLTLGFFD